MEGNKVVGRMRPRSNCGATGPPPIIRFYFQPSKKSCQAIKLLLLFFLSVWQLALPLSLALPDFRAVTIFCESVPVGTDLQRWDRFSARLTIGTNPAYLVHCWKTHVFATLALLAISHSFVKETERWEILGWPFWNPFPFFCPSPPNVYPSQPRQFHIYAPVGGWCQIQATPSRFKRRASIYMNTHGWNQGKVKMENVHRF